MPEEEVSYYELALTSRQVLVTFIVALACVALAFFAGVWVGQQDEGAGAAVADVNAAGEEEAPALGFFTDDSDDDGGGEDNNRAPAGGTTAEPEQASGAGRATGERRSTRSQPAEGTTSAPPAAARGTVAPSGSIVLQVLSSPNRGIAEDILDRLTAAGYAAYMQAFDSGGEVFYRVRVGPFEDRAGADAAKRRVDDSFNVQTWITTAE